ncbi:kinase-like domain-containing protein [Aspergillus pseudodeflectus]|uniref:Kinase-like domain-containing protein n=1 Tax=Aspergillus pseudodeflectus TaxID=176178 RepID=A0ABR4KMT8_9EURO
MEKPADASGDILHSLQDTPYACSSVKELCGGSGNATYRGKLSKSLHDGTDTVIIKHSEETCPTVPHVALSTNQCITEREILTAIQESSASRVSYKDVVVQCPRIHHYIPHERTRILEDFPHDSTLHEWLSNSDASRDVARLAALGAALGTWLMRFHVWSESAAGSLSGAVLANTNSTGKNLNRTKLQAVKRQCDDEKVRDYAADLLSSAPKPGDVVVHGEFSTRNILIQSSLNNPDRSPDCSLAIIGWETACYDHFTRDVANMIAGLYMLKHFSGSESAMTVLQAFVANYPALSEEEAYRTVAQVGENFFHWGAYAPETHTEEQVQTIVDYGKALIIMGMEDREGVMGTFLRCLLKPAARLDV